MAKFYHNTLKHQAIKLKAVAKAAGKENLALIVVTTVKKFELDEDN